MKYTALIHLHISVQNTKYNCLWKPRYVGNAFCMNHLSKSIKQMYHLNKSFYLRILWCPGDIQIGMVNKKGQLEVEVIRARGLIQKPGSKSLPGESLLLHSEPAACDSNSICLSLLSHNITHQAVLADTKAVWFIRASHTNVSMHC